MQYSPNTQKDGGTMPHYTTIALSRARPKKYSNISVYYGHTAQPDQAKSTNAERLSHLGNSGNSLGASLVECRGCVLPKHKAMKAPIRRDAGGCVCTRELVSEQHATAGGRVYRSKCFLCLFVYLLYNNKKPKTQHEIINAACKHRR
ncbi:unnamed protein product [Ceratitis capitata]|uniref:(Mediterranean fruit fly) hypothetical protein n=1 Tax=Ceratitis capitata TaxID=7213 RepID=A0A811VJN5_CERCA|nr:unnamed protein product [Ceratitis capitata]